MKHIAMQMALFGGAGSALSERVSAGILVKQSFVVARDDDGKTIKDRNGVPVLAKDKSGQHIPASETIKLASRSSKDDDGNLKADCLQSITGMKGQQLMGFEREARSELAQGALADYTRKISSGQFTFATYRRNLRNGAIAFTIKPVFGGKSIAATSDDELLDEARRRGLKVEANPAKGNGEVPAEEVREAATPTPPARKGKGKGKGKNTPAAATA